MLVSGQNSDAPAEVADNSEPVDEGDSSQVADQSVVDDDDLVTRVTQHLLAPPLPVQASKDHANSIHSDNKEGVKAYAKIAALDWTYFITKLTVNIGRSSEPAQLRGEQAQDDDDAVHIDLGPSKLISRLHAVIYFNRDQEKWWLLVRGRNSLKVDGIQWKVGQAGPLQSGEVIEIGGVEMMFALPTELSPLRIAQQYLERAGIKSEHSAAPSRPTRHPLPSGDGAHSSSPSKSSRGQGAQKPLAPAPPDYKRPGTPPTARGRSSAVAKTPLVEQTAGPLLMSNSDVDLSLDENRHIKPQFSYAQMITQAILNTSEQKLNLSGIYQYIQDRYAYYRHQPVTGWQAGLPLWLVTLIRNANSRFRIRSGTTSLSTRRLRRLRVPQMSLERV